MAKNTSILLGDHFENYIDQQVKNGRYASASEVIRAALRLFEEEEKRKQLLVHALEKGEQSGVVANFNRIEFLQDLHKKYSGHEV
jgi:antitoxin ParD1/3/4